MYIFGISISLILQVLLIIHVIRTGRDRFWIYILAFIPGAGIIAYLLIEVLPDLRHSRALNATGQAISKTINPTKQIRALEAQLAATNTVANKLALAKALLEYGDNQRAVDLLKDARQGFYKDDPKVCAALARAYGKNGQAAESAALFKEYMAANPDLVSASDRFYLAQAYQASGQAAEAEVEYRAAMAKSGSFEIKFRLAELLQSQGRADESRALLTEIVNLSKTIPRHSQKLERDWTKSAQSILQSGK